MRSRLALLVAAAVVFAPGWQGEGAPDPSTGSDLAARVLAPTVDKGRVRDSLVDVKHQLGLRQTKRRPGIVSITVTPFALAAIAFLLLWVVSCLPGSLIHLFRPRSRFSRAPPRLQPA